MKSENIFCKEANKQFSSQEELFKYLIANKSELKSLKKSANKYTDAVDCLLSHEGVIKGIVAKADGEADNPTEIKVRVVMNTTNILDSHGDVHIDGLWKRTLQHSSRKIHLQEHKRTFDAVISNDAKASVINTTFKDLGIDLEGNTQALIFNSLVKQIRNPLMFEQYKNGWVNNHSVGMQYVDFVICINSEEKWAKEEKENWDKYYPLIVNKEDADNSGYFWAVLEAKLIEGSAVLFGSNWATPTLETGKTGLDPLSNIIDPPQGTQKQQLTNLINKVSFNI